MNYSFCVALNRLPAACNVDVVTGDQFTVAVKFYDVDGDDAPANLAGSTATLEVLRENTLALTRTGTIASGVATFDLTDADFACLIGRSALRVKLTRAGRTMTALDGNFTVRD